MRCKKNSMNKIICPIGGIVILVLLFTSFVLWKQSQGMQFEISNIKSQILKRDETLLETKSQYEQELLSAEELLKERREAEKVHTMLVGGDVMLDRGVEAKIDAHGGDYSFPFELIRDYLKSADISFVNLEGSISNIGSDTGKKYSFRFDPQSAPALAHAGVDIVSLANNHALDWGRESLCATIDYLNEQHIAFVGGGCNSNQSEAAYEFLLGDTSVALVAFTEFYQGAHATETKPGISKYDEQYILGRVDKLRQSHDIVMVSMHWGTEYEPRANDYQTRFAHEMIDAGADVIIGHHPHVPEEVERYGAGWIIYSLGNFVFDQSWSTETMQGLLAEIKIQNKKVIDIVPVPIQLNNNFQPYVVG